MGKNFEEAMRNTLAVGPTAGRTRARSVGGRSITERCNLNVTIGGAKSKPLTDKEGLAVQGFARTTFVRVLRLRYASPANKPKPVLVVHAILTSMEPCQLESSVSYSAMFCAHLQSR